MPSPPPLAKDDVQKSCAKAIQTARNAEATINDNMTEHAIDFLKKLTVFEVCYKSLLADYLSRRNKSKATEDLIFNTNQAKSVLKECGIELEKEHWENAFTSSKKPGERKSRNIRNSLIHDPTSNEIRELESKYEVLMASMNAFIEAVESKAKG